jgi:acyl transferase domain-containing protein/acyl carrier protein
VTEPFTSDSADSAVAVIGLALRFPGANDPASFWRNLAAGVESIRFFSPEELRAAGIPAAALDDPRYVRANPVLDGVDLCDAGFFGLTPREAELLDPQQRLFLECAFEAIEAAGYDPEAYPGPVGVYAGVGLNSYLLNNLYPHRDLMQSASGFEVMLGNDKDFAATRVAYKLNLKGPAITVQTACSTSLVAVHLAVQGLLSGECDAALAGGASVRIPQTTGYWYRDGMILSPDGHCRAFDAEARGTVGGNGVGAVLLKRLADALEDGDPIFAVVKGSAVNNDGARKVGYTAPGSAGQEAVIREALAVAAVEPDTLGYVEAHGTGTALGDPVEIDALCRVFRARTERRGFCAVGSVKTNLGHLDTAAGIAGFIKTVLALHHGRIPPSLHYRNPNPAIDFAGSPFFVNTEARPFGQRPRRAGVSSFGIGGTNAHAVLEEAPFREPSGPSRDWQLLPLSARTGPALERAAARLADHLRAHPELPLADAAYTLGVGRKGFDRRQAWVCRDAAEAAAVLSDFRAEASGPEAGPCPVAFLFPGQGSQYPGMGRELYRNEPPFRDLIDHCAGLLRPHLDLDLQDLLYPAETARAEAEARLAETRYAQPALFVVGYALARLWMDWGVRPDALLGHSVGEYAAACLAGVFSLEDALAVVALRGRLMQDTPGGAMLAVPLAEADIGPWLSGEIALAAVNGPGWCVLAGPEPAVAETRRRLEGAGRKCRPLANARAFHSPLMEPVLEPFIRALARLRLAPPALPVVSNLTGAPLTAEQATDPGYWGEHLRRTVRFADGVGTLLAEPRRLLLEVGPGRTLTGLAGTHGSLKLSHRLLNSLPAAAGDDQRTLLTALGGLWTAGAPVDWAGFYAGQRRRRVVLPTYPFERQRHWIDPPDSTDRVPAPAAGRRADPSEWFYLPYWKPAPAPAPEPPAAATWLLLADASGLAERLAAELRGLGHRVVAVAEGPEFRRSGLSPTYDYVLNPADGGDWLKLFEDLGDALPGLEHLVHLQGVGPVPAASLAERIARAEVHGVYGLVHLVKALEQVHAVRPLRLSVVTSHMQDVDGAAPCPEKALALGAVTVIPQEYRQIACRSIDLDFAGPAEPDQVQALLAELLRAPADPVVALRRGRRWVPAFERVDMAGPARLRERGVYLITGGFGGIGLALARHLAATVKARLVLTGRRPPGPEARSAIAELETLGADVLALAADVTDEAALRAAVDRAVTRFGPIHGAIHAAGVPGGGLLSLKTADAAARILAPKVRGALVLDAVCPDLDFLAFCSSLSGTLGGIGQVDYCAANAFLDAYAAHRSAAGRPTLAIAWDTWRDVGMAVTAAAPGELRELRARSLAEAGIAPAEGALAFDRALRAGLPRLLVSTQDFAARYRDRTRQLDLSMDGLADARKNRGGHPRPELSVPYAAPATALEIRLAELWREHLGFDRIGAEDDYFELGGDSLKAIALVNALQQALGEVVHVNAVFEAPTVRRLAGYLAAHYPAAVARLGGAAEPAGTGADEGPVDEAALERLRRLLPRAVPRTGDGARNPRAVFLLSPPRSGSTLLRVILAGHPRLFAPPELALLNYDTLGQRRDALAGGDASLLQGPAVALMHLKGCGAAEAEALMAGYEARNLDTRRFYRELQRLADDRLLIDKSPNYVYDLEVLKRAEADFDAPLYILLLRHPCGMIHSYEEARMDLLLPGAARRELPFGRRRLAELLWLQSYRNLRDFMALVPPERRHALRFEDLVAEPRAAVEKLCRFLGVDFEPALLDPYRDGDRRMTGGLHADSRPLGDLKFHGFKAIDPAAADRWREDYRTDFLGAPTRELAEFFGYHLGSGTPAAIDGAGVDSLSDAEVDAALEALLAELRTGGPQP